MPMHAASTTLPDVASAWRVSSPSSPPTAMTITGTAVVLPPLHNMENATHFARWFTPPRLDAALAMHTSGGPWCRMRRKQTLQVTVIGVSVTSGCGAVGGGNRQCVASLGWARRVADSYARLTSFSVAAFPRIEWSVWPKNAAPARFWLQCTKTSFHLSQRTDLILIETEPTLGVNEEHDLLQLVTQLRTGAPNAALAFVMWPSQAQLLNRGVERLVRHVSEREVFDVASASVLLDAAASSGEPPESFYDDRVHPNPDGHTLLAGLVSAWLLKRLSPSTACGVEGNTIPLPTPPRQMTRATAFERCFSRADQMPVSLPLPPGWRLRDEGGAKGVVKQGYVPAL